MKTHICSENFVPYKFHPKGSDFEPDAKNLKSYIRQIDMDSQWTDNQGSGIIVSNEAYSLDLSNDGRVLIKIVSTQGGLHAIIRYPSCFTHILNLTNMFIRLMHPLNSAEWLRSED